MQPIEQTFYVLWLIGMSWILLAFLLRVRRNLRACPNRKAKALLSGGAE